MMRKSLLLLAAIILLGALAFAEPESFFDNAQINSMIDDNYALVQQNGWAELVIPEELHHFGRDRISPNALEAGQKLIDHGYKAYVVGGTVRDFVLGTKVNDFDIATDASIDKQLEIFGEDLQLHGSGSGKIFAVIHFPDEDIDLATLQNIPAPYHGKPGIPEFDPSLSQSDSALFDSFQRDLTMNSLYYDLTTGDIIDYHGGLYCLREGFMDTAVEGNLALSTNPMIIRLLRFKARYGFRLSDSLEAAMRNNALDYARKIEPLEVENQLRRMWFGGYAADCFDVLMDYDLFGYFHPPVADICHTEEYQAYAHEALERLDAKKAAGGIVDENEAVALLLYPAVRKLAETMPAEEAIKAVLDQEETVYEWWMDTRQLSEQYLRDLLAADPERTSQQALEAAFLSAPLWSDKDIASLIDENHLHVLESGWTELVIPESLHHIPLSIFSPNAVDLGQRLLAHGYKAYLVGGGIRDLLMGRPRSDYDVVTDAPIEVQRELLGDMLELHTVAGGRTFGFVHYPSEVVDLATFQNIPASFHGLPNIPDFDPKELTSTQMLNDSFERDLTVNALYYDMDTGDIVDYHDGIYDLREGILDTMADPRICLENDSTIALRALRFKAKYNFDFSEPLEATMQERAAEFLASLDRDTLTFHLPKFFSEGYAASCFDVLLDYGALPALFPAVGDVWETEAYQQAVMRVLRSIDNRHDDLQGSDAAVMSFAAILAYATQYDEVDAALDAQAVKYAFSADEREAVRRQMTALLEVDLPAAA